MDITGYIQAKGHGIDVLLALYAVSQSKSVVEWKDIKEWASKRGLIISDGTYRARRRELEELGLIEKERVDPLKFNVKLTPKGHEIAKILEEAIEKLKATMTK